jgi:GAF domain-containing protein
MTYLDEHTGLQRVAALLGGKTPDAVFAAVTEELAQIVDDGTGEQRSEMAVIARYEADQTFTVLDFWGEPGDMVPRSSRWRLEGTSAIVQVYKTGARARVDDHDGVRNPVAGSTGVTGTISAVAVPITIDGALWGTASVHGRRRLPDGIEPRVEEFARLIGIAVATADVRLEARRLAEEQAALRRVATLVGRGVPYEELFAVVAEEVGRLLDADAASLIRYEVDVGTVMAWWAPPSRERVPIGHRWPARGGLATRIAATRRTVRIDDWAPARGALAEFVRDQLGIRSSLGGPIIVNERVWGALLVHSQHEPLPAQAELRLVSFAELVATTIANEEARAEVRRLADRQAALLRVATIVAGQPSPQSLFATVVEEVSRVLSFDAARLLRYRGDGTAQLEISWPEDGLVPGTVFPLDGDSVTARVLRTGRPAQIDDYTNTPGTLAQTIRDRGGRAAVGSPVVVDGRLWGVLLGVHNRQEPMPAGIESRLEEFTALVATAISNVEARSEVRRLADRQAALRRVATLVAGEPSPEEVFATVTAEVSRVMDFDVTRLMRFRVDGVTHLVSSPADDVAPGANLALEGDSVAVRVHRTGRAARIDDYSSAQGPIAEAVRAHRGQAAVGAPIVVDGLLWGVLVGVSNRAEPLPEDAESRLEEFTALVATAISNVEARAEVRRLAEEQAALRRVATLVARQLSAEEIFASVVEELGRVLAFDVTRLMRYLDDGRVAHVVSWPPGDTEPGTIWPLDGESVTALVQRSGRPTRIDDFSGLSGTFAEGARAAGITATAGAPIVVEGQLWGVLVGVAMGPEPLPPGVESRIEEFTALIANAISNVQARAEVNRLAEEQAVLRRFATLVARQPSAQEVFETVAQEVGRLLSVDATRLIRFEADDTGTMVSTWPTGGTIPNGANGPLDGDNISSRIRRAWAPARFDDYTGATGSFAVYAQEAGTRAAAGAPIIVDGRMWGALIATSREPNSLASNIESRIEEFTALVAIAISNVEARAALAASRERIVVTTDETRRRFERDLHDGAQQRLVSLALELRLAQQEAPAGPRERIADAVEGITDVLEELRELSSGLHPAILSEGGLRPALRALARRSSVPVRLRAEPDERFEEHVEVAAYYVVSEALANAAKHSGASIVEVTVARRDGGLLVTIRDDGAGGADAAKGSGLVGLSDRVEALGGTMTIVSPRGAGTTVEVELPLSPSPS